MKEQSRNQEARMRKVLHGYFRQAVRDPSVRAAKKSFIQEQFARQPFFLLRPAIVAPCLGFALLAVLIIRLDFPFMTPTVVPPNQPVLQSEIQVVETFARPTQQKVLVEQVSSQMGSPVIYQKTSNQVPLTVIWVLTRGCAT